jgi:AAA15 family ATPase/GTPase
MYTNFRIQNFRGFKDFELQDIQRVNLIAGKNNVGKTSLLEALFIHGNPANPELALRIIGFRGLKRLKVNAAGSYSTPWDSLFYNFDNEQTIALSSKHTANDLLVKIRLSDPEKDNTSVTLATEAAGQTALSSNIGLQTLVYEVIEAGSQISKYQLSITDDGKLVMPSLPKVSFQHYFFPSNLRESFDVIAEQWTSLIHGGHEEFVLQTLKTVEPKLTKLELLSLQGESIIHGMLDSKLRVPIIFMGDGIVRLLQFILAIGTARDRFVLIDEIENGLHYSVQTAVWKAIAKAAELFNVQVFATTHSREMIQAAYEAFKETPEDDFRFHRLDRDKKANEIYPTTYDAYSMEAAMDVKAEVR